MLRWQLYCLYVDKHIRAYKRKFTYIFEENSSIFI